MRSPLTRVVVSVALLTTLLPARGGAQSPSSVAVSASFGSRTSLEVSSELLRFEVTDPTEPAFATVDITAAARTVPGATVVLFVVPASGLLGPGGAADVETELTFDGQGDGLFGGAVSVAAPAPVGRWTGSGFRTGRVTFRLRAGARGTYTLPVRFVLATNGGDL